MGKLRLREGNWLAADQSKLVAELSLQARSPISIFLLYHVSSLLYPRQKGSFLYWQLFKRLTDIFLASASFSAGMSVLKSSFKGLPSIFYAQHPEFLSESQLIYQSPNYQVAAFGINSPEFTPSKRHRSKSVFLNRLFPSGKVFLLSLTFQTLIPTFLYPHIF